MREYPCYAVLTDGEPTAAKDWLGNWFCVGDLVAYCISAGRGQMMAFGRVQKLRIREGSKGRNEWTRNADGGHTPTWVPVPQDEWIVEVQVLTEKTSGHWGNGKRTRPAWVNEMNITAVTGIESGIINYKDEELS